MADARSAQQQPGAEEPSCRHAFDPYEKGNARACLLCGAREDDTVAARPPVNSSPVVIGVAYHDETLCELHADGTFTTGPSYTPDAAARAFWECVAAEHERARRQGSANAIDATEPVVHPATPDPPAVPPDAFIVAAHAPSVSPADKLIATAARMLAIHYRLLSSGGHFGLGGGSILWEDLEKDVAACRDAQRMGQATGDRIRADEAVEVIRRIRGVMDRGSLMLGRDTLYHAIMSVLDSTPIGAIGVEPTEQGTVPVLPAASAAGTLPRGAAGSEGVRVRKGAPSDEVPDQDHSPLSQPPSDVSPARADLEASIRTARALAESHDTWLALSEKISIHQVLHELHRLRTVIRTGGAMYRAERAAMSIPGGDDPDGQPIRPTANPFAQADEKAAQELADDFRREYERETAGLESWLVRRVAGMIRRAAESERDSIVRWFRVYAELRTDDAIKAHPLYFPRNPNHTMGLSYDQAIAIADALEDHNG